MLTILELKKRMKTFIREVISATLIVLGILSAGLGLKGFLLPSRFIDGGATGISMLTSTMLQVPLWILILVINVPFILIGYWQISKVFSAKSAIAIIGLSGCLAIVKYPDITEDKLLTAVFGGFFVGAGIGFTIRGGGVLDGTEVAALLLSKKIGVTVGDVILILNIFIFSVAAVFLGIEPALYSMLTYFSASKTIDFIIHGIEEYNGVIIVSSRSEEIKTSILKDLGRGVTVYKGRGGLTEVEQDSLFCVVTRLEVHKIKRIIKEIDETSFIVVHPISDVSGGMVKKRILH